MQVFLKAILKKMFPFELHESYILSAVTWHLGCSFLKYDEDTTSIFSFKGLNTC